MSSAVAEAPAGSLRSLSTEDLFAEFESLFGQTVSSLIRMAEVVAELERRGADLARLCNSMVPHLRRIAAHQLLPEAVLSFQFRPAILNSVSQLPITDQRRLVEKPEVEVYVPDSDSSEKVPLDDLHIHQARAVFGNGKIRTPAEQRVYLRGASVAAKDAKPVTTRNYRVRADRERGGVWVGAAFVKSGEIVAALAELAGPLPTLTIDDSDTATARLSSAEKDKLRQNEKRRGLPEWHLIREALRAYGLI
jgi:hypothetical protein